MPPTQAVDRPPMLLRMVGLGRSFAPIPGLTNPARSFACLEMAPTLWGPSSRLCQPGAWIPPTPSVRGRLDHVCEARRDRDRQGHVSHDCQARRTATGLQRTPSVSVASSYHSRRRLARTGQVACFETPPASLAPGGIPAQGLAPPARARPYARGYLSVGHGSQMHPFVTSTGHLGHFFRTLLYAAEYTHNDSVLSHA